MSKPKKRTMRRRRTGPSYMAGDKTIEAAVSEFLDDEMTTIREKIDPKIGSKFSDTNIRIVSWEIQIINPNLLLIAVAKMDDKHYGAFYEPNSPPFPPRGFAEELHLTFGGQYKNSFLIHDLAEWQFVTAFFNTHNVYESQRIFNWSLQAKLGTDMREMVKKLPWFQKLSKDRGITAEEVSSAILRGDPNIQKS